MKNQVIKCLTEAHGKEIIEYWNSLGFDTRHYEGSACEEHRDTCIYYGIIKGWFDNYSLLSVQQNGAEIIEIPTKKENMKTLKIKREQLLEIHGIACSTWKKTIEGYGSRVNLITDEIAFTQEEVDAMFKASDNKQLITLEKIFGSQKKVIDFDKIKTGSKVKIMNTGKLCNGPVDQELVYNVVFYKTPYLIGSNPIITTECGGVKIITLNFSAMNLLKELDTQLLNKIGRVYNDVNHGGCGIFAYLLAEELTRVGIKNELCWLAYDQFDIDIFNNCSTLQELNYNGIRCVHVLVVVDGNFIDCTGVFKTVEESGWGGNSVNIINDYKTIEKVVLNQCGWNECFDRKQIPFIEKNIKKIIKSLTVKNW